MSSRQKLRSYSTKQTAKPKKPPSLRKLFHLCFSAENSHPEKKSHTDISRKENVFKEECYKHPKAAALLTAEVARGFISPGPL